MRKLAGILLAAALMAPVALSAQNQPGPGAGRGMRANPVAIAIAHKADLGLSDDVAAKLETIAKQLQEKNAPIMQKMMEARQAAGDYQSMTVEQQQAFREKIQPISQQMRENTQAARAEMEKLLTPEQLTKLGEFVAAEAPQRRMN